jgi:hypothetical protein
LKQLPALNPIYQIGDFIANSANPVNAQKLTVSNALYRKRVFINSFLRFATLIKSALTASIR